LRDTTNYAICYHGRFGPNKVINIQGSTDANWVSDLYRKRFTSGYVFNLFGRAISWISRRHVVLTLSTIEFEYKATTYANNEVVWLQRLCSGIGFVYKAI